MGENIVRQSRCGAHLKQKTSEEQQIMIILRRLILLLLKKNTLIHVEDLLGAKNKLCSVPSRQVCSAVLLQAYGMSNRPISIAPSTRPINWNL